MCIASCFVMRIYSSWQRVRTNRLSSSNLVKTSRIQLSLFDQNFVIRNKTKHKVKEYYNMRTRRKHWPLLNVFLHFRAYVTLVIYIYPYNTTCMTRTALMNVLARTHFSLEWHVSKKVRLQHVGMKWKVIWLDQRVYLVHRGEPPVTRTDNSTMSFWFIRGNSWQYRAGSRSYRVRAPRCERQPRNQL